MEVTAKDLMEKLQEAIDTSIEGHFSDLVKVARSRRRALGLVFGDDEAALEQCLTALTANLEKPNAQAHCHFLAGVGQLRVGNHGVVLEGNV